ncbi:MAG: DUF1611 domain-containing protein [Clostridia bacterium]|nr:DUF1611 domain-containing protein [Clostridia bacterium]
MRKAAVHPFNKITRGLVKFRDLLNIEIKSVIDFTFNTGIDAGLETHSSSSSIKIIDSIEEGLKDVDILILNDPGTAMDSFMDYYIKNNLDKKWKELVLEASRKGIEIISTNIMEDVAINNWLQEMGISIRTFTKSREEILEYINKSNKVASKNNMRCVSIFATRACLGKFTAQMELFRGLKKDGKKVKALITEPTHFLFGQPGADILVFNNRAPLEIYEYFEAVKKDMELEGNEYLIVASQSSLLAQNKVNILWNTGMIKTFATGIVLLVVGYDDDEKIRDCMDLLRIYGSGKRPCALLLPDKIETSYGVYESKTPEEVQRRKTELKEKFGVEIIQEICDINNIKDMVCE